MTQGRSKDGTAQNQGKNRENWSKRTQLVHGGTRRSQYNEVSEAIFLTQGFVYDTAEQAEARFIKVGDDEFIYARYGNPTVRMFEDRISAYLGFEDGFACASGMAAVNGALTALLKAGDHVVASRALFGSCLYVLQDVLARFGVEVTLIETFTHFLIQPWSIHTLSMGIYLMVARIIAMYQRLHAITERYQLHTMSTW